MSHFFFFLLCYCVLTVQNNEYHHDILLHVYGLSNEIPALAIALLLSVREAPGKQCAVFSDHSLLRTVQTARMSSETMNSDVVEGLRHFSPMLGISFTNK